MSSVLFGCSRSSRRLSGSAISNSVLSNGYGARSPIGESNRCVEATGPLAADPYGKKRHQGGAHYLMSGMLSPKRDGRNFPAIAAGFPQIRRGGELFFLLRKFGLTTRNFLAAVRGSFPLKRLGGGWPTAMGISDRYTRCFSSSC